MAQALFKSWFVDFDPVRAKMAGESRDSICKRLKLTPEILDLFPDRLVDSELGEIPEGWHNKAISEIVKRVSVGTKYDTKKVFEIGKVPVLDQGKSGIIGYHNGTPDIHASPTNPIIIFANHTCYMRLIPYDFSVIQNVLPFYGDGVDTIWAYFATRDKISFSEYKGHWPDFILEPVIVPSKALTTYFRTIISDLISAIFVADAMNEPISKTRDTLLPKLISGELRVSDPALLI
jgi:type I restriction enzyme S subunit